MRKQLRAIVSSFKPFRARTSFGSLLRVEDERRSLVIEKRENPRAALLSVRGYVRLAIPEPQVLRIIGAESKANHTDELSSQQIDKSSGKRGPSERSRNDFASSGRRHEHHLFCRAQARRSLATYVWPASETPLSRRAIRSTTR